MERRRSEMLELTNISKTFNPGTVNEKTAISHLNFKLEDGDFVTIVGSNGAGKSTLFNAIAGSFYVDEGSIYLDGKKFTGNIGDIDASTIESMEVLKDAAAVEKYGDEAKNGVILIKSKKQ